MYDYGRVVRRVCEECEERQLKLEWRNVGTKLEPNCELSRNVVQLKQENDIEVEYLEPTGQHREPEDFDDDDDNGVDLDRLSNPEQYDEGTQSPPALDISDLTHTHAPRGRGREKLHVRSPHTASR